MKKILITSIFPMLCICASDGATTPWWLQPTVCQLVPTDCYAGMGSGFESEMWDTSSRCWGLKLICPDALTTSAGEPKPMERKDIEQGKNISKDFDTSLLASGGDCFGRRRTSKDGTTASVNGKYVNVWCNGILEDPDEFLDNGEITYGAQPTCSKLAEYGYVAVENGRCYGKYFDTSEYYIDCGSDLLPQRLIVLNGAENTPSISGPSTMTEVEKLFDKMYSTSKDRKSKFFKD